SILSAAGRGPPRIPREGTYLVNLFTLNLLLTSSNSRLKCFKHFHARLFETFRIFFMQSLFTSRDVIALTGITARQLQWWDERRIVVPARQGHRRLYSMEDLADVAVIFELRRRGFSLQRVRKGKRVLQL